MILTALLTNARPEVEVRNIGQEQRLGNLRDYTRLISLEAVGGTSTSLRRRPHDFLEQILAATNKRCSLIAQRIDRIHAACAVCGEPNGHQYHYA
jgi:hypothetical protein